MHTSVSNSDFSAEIDFLRAVKNGDIKEVKKFLASGKFDSMILVPGEDEGEENEQPLWKNEEEYGFIKLILACRNGQLEVVRLKLLKC